MHTFYHYILDLKDHVHCIKYRCLFSSTVDPFTIHLTYIRLIALPSAVRQVSPTASLPIRNTPTLTSLIF
jgi:hypothetical protein